MRTCYRGFFASAAFILCVTGQVPSAYAQSKLMADPSAVNLEKLSAKARDEFKHIQQDKYHAKVLPVHLDSRAFYGNLVSVELDGVTSELTKQTSELQPDGSTSWTAWTGRDNKFTSAVFSIKNGQIWGTIHTKNGVYELTPLEGDAHALILLNMPDVKDDGDTPQSPNIKRAAQTEQESNTAAAPLAVTAAATVANPPVRILVAYSAHAASALGSTANLNAQINQAIAQINAANVNDGVTFRAQLAGTIQVAYTGPYDAATTLTAFEAMADVKSAHDSMSADLMVMLEAIPATSEAGLAAGINVTAANAYAVVSTVYMTSNY